MAILTKTEQRARRAKRVRSRVQGTEERPRLSIFKSNTRLTAQIINDATKKTLVAVSSHAEKGDTPRARAEAAAKTLADNAIKAGISKVVYDRGGFKYTGTVKAFADAVRAGGLSF